MVVIADLCDDGNIFLGFQLNLICIDGIRDMCTLSFEQDGVCVAKYGGVEIKIDTNSDFIIDANIFGDGKCDEWKNLVGSREIMRDVAKVIGVDPKVFDRSVHIKLLPYMARWISPECAVEVSEIVYHYYTDKLTRKVSSLTEEHTDTVMMYTKLLKENMKKLEDEKTKKYVNTLTIGTILFMILFALIGTMYSALGIKPVCFFELV